MSKKNVNIKIDTVPYLPNIYLNEKDYIKKDFIDFSNAISANKIIFIINMDANIVKYNGSSPDQNHQYYNDPNFLLYGKSSPTVPTEFYKIPPINIFYNNKLGTNNFNYKVLSFRYQKTNFDDILLQDIGYTIQNISTPTDGVNVDYYSLTTSSRIPTPVIGEEITINIQLFKNYVESDIVMVSNISNTINYFTGTVVSYDAETGILTLTPDFIAINSTFTTDAIYQVNLVGNEFFRELEITDFSSNTFTVYLYYFTYTDPNTTKNPSNIVNYNNFTNNIFYNKINWNVFIYPFVNNVSDYIFNETPDGNKDVFVKKSLYNYINIIDFSDVKLTNFKDNIDFIYFEGLKNNLIKPIDNTYYLSKNIRSFNDYINKNKDDENIFISLNEINYFYYDSLEENLAYLNSNNNTTIKNFLKKNNTFVNTNVGTSFTMDNKISYLNTKYKYFNNTNYAQYISNIDLTEKLYEFDLIYCVDSYLDIISYIEYTKNKEEYFNEFSYINGNLKKLLLLINPNLIYDNYKNSSSVSTRIINLINNQINLQINSDDKFIVEPSNDLEIINFNTKSYIICRYLFILSFINYTGVTSKIQYYYIYINIAFYNSNYINIIDQFKTTLFDVCYVCKDYLSSTVTLSPTIFNVLKKTNMYQNIINWSFIDTKIYSFIYNYDNYSQYKNKENSIIINHFYYLLTNIVPNVKYNICSTGYCNPNVKTDPCEYIINNMNDIIYEKINNFISNIIILNNTFVSLGYNKYFSRTDNIISIVTDTNINEKYFETFEYLPEINTLPNNNTYPGTETTYPQINYLPFGIYKMYKFNNSNPSSYFNTENNIYLWIQDISIIIQRNYNLLIRVSPPYEYDDKYYELVKDNNFNDFINTNNSLFTNKSEIYLIITDIDSEIINVQENRILCYKLFNYNNGNTLINNRLQLYVNSNSYNNFYEMNIIYESYPSTEINTMALDYNNLKFNPHINEFIKDILTFDLLRFNNNLLNKSELNFNIEIINNINNSNNNLYRFQTIINYCVYLIYLWKIIILIKKVKCYFIIINNINKYNYYTFPVSVPDNSEITLDDFYKIILNDIQELKDCCNYVYNLNFFTIPLSKLQNFITLFNNITELTEINLQNIQNLFYDNTYSIDPTIKNIPLIIIYLENLIINFNEDKNNTKNYITELLLELNNDELNNYVTDFLNKYNNSFNILETFENSILNLQPENELLFLIKNQALIYLYNINLLFEIINFNEIFDNVKFNIDINSLKLIKKNYIFSTTELETNLKYSYFCIRTFIESLNEDPKIKNVPNLIFNLSILTLTEEQLVDNQDNYINNLPLTIDNTNLNNLLTQINILISIFPYFNPPSPSPSSYYIEFYYVNDMVYYLNKYVYLIKELLLIEAYKKQLLTLPVNDILTTTNDFPINNPQPYDVLNNNLNENIITIKNIISLIDKVYKNNDQQAIHDVLNINMNNDNINIDFYSQINLYSYNDHLQYLSNNFIENIITPTIYGPNLKYTLVSNNYIYGFTINEEIYNMIELYYQNKNNFITTYASIIENNILIKNSLNYGYVNTPLYYTS
jgi:hypothetical protein